MAEPELTPGLVAALPAFVDSPPLAPWEPDDADRRPLLPLELLGWDAAGRLVAVRVTGDEVLLRSGRPAVRRSLDVRRVTSWARAGRVTLHCAGGEDVELRLLATDEWPGHSVGDERSSRPAGPGRVLRSGQRSADRDAVASALVRRVAGALPDVQVGVG